MNNKKGAYCLAIFCVFYQASTTIAFKLIYQSLGTEPAMFAKCLLYGGNICVMGFYAIIWQFVLKRLELSIANSIMSLVPVLVFIGGIIFFNEVATIFNIIGLSMILFGLFLITYSKKETV